MAWLIQRYFWSGWRAVTCGISLVMAGWFNLLWWNWWGQHTCGGDANKRCLGGSVETKLWLGQKWWRCYDLGSCPWIILNRFAGGSIISYRETWWLLHSTQIPSMLGHYEWGIWGSGCVGTALFCRIEEGDLGWLIYNEDLDNWGSLLVRLIEWEKATEEDNCKNVFIHTEINIHTN